MLGAPEFVLREDYTKYQGRIEQYTSRGFRVLVFGSYDGEPDGKPLTGTVTPLGYVLLLNKVREEAPATFKYFADQGVAIKLFPVIIRSPYRRLRSRPELKAQRITWMREH